MSQDERDVLVEYYHREIDYLRRSGAEFARRHPKIAERLELSAQDSPDPQVERLLESFAFLTGRIQYNIDAEFPELPTALLESLYPQLIATVPSLSIAQFHPEPSQYKPNTPDRAPRGTALIAEESRGLSCTLTTCYDVDLWPLEVEDVAVRDARLCGLPDDLNGADHVLVLRLKTLGAYAFKDLALEHLRFHLTGGRRLTTQVCDLVFGACADVLLRGADRDVRLGAAAVSPVGFDPEDSVLPYPEAAHHGYRLIQEYFCFPEKFHFFDLSGLDALRTGALGALQKVEVLIPLNGRLPSGLHLDQSHIRLGCTPVINAFPRTCDPVRIDGLEFEYPLVVDIQKERSLEIHTVLSVKGVDTQGGRSFAVSPLLSYDHAAVEDKRTAFWHARRRPSAKKDIPGTDVFLSFIDTAFSPTQPAYTLAIAEALCTNRDVATLLPPGAVLQIETDLAASRITLLNQPTPPVPPTLGGKTLWRLVSSLSLNHLSLDGGATGLTALREMLTLYGGLDHAVVHRQIAGIEEMSCRRVSRPARDGEWYGLCRGTEVTLTLNPDRFKESESSMVLFASVLDRFFGLYVSAESFCQLVVKTRTANEEWKRWPQRMGEIRLL